MAVKKLDFHECFFCKHHDRVCVNAFTFGSIEKLPALLEPWRHHAFAMCKECESLDASAIVGHLCQFAREQITVSN